MNRTESVNLCLWQDLYYFYPQPPKMNSLGTLVTLYLQMSPHSEYLIFFYLLRALHTFTYISQAQVNDFSYYIPMNVVRVSISVQVVQISLHHSVFTLSICGVHHYHTTSCGDSCRGLKTGKHWSEVFGIVLSLLLDLPYRYSCSLWVFLLGKFNTLISNYSNGRLIL